MQGITKSGFKYEIKPIVVRDMEFIDLLAESFEDGTKLTPAIKKALGKEQQKALYEHVRNEDGLVLIEDVSNEFLEILAEVNKADETKN